MRMWRDLMRIAVDMSVSPDLVAAARARGLNLSRVLEERLIDLVAAYNARITEAGTFSDEHRSF